MSLITAFQTNLFDFENKDNEILKNLSSLFLFQFSNAVMVPCSLRSLKDFQRSYSAHVSINRISGIVVCKQKTSSI